MKCFLLILLFLGPVAFSQVQTVSSIKNALRERNITTMEEFIADLPQDLLTNFTLMHESKSLHGSSYAEPRAILFGKTGQWIVTFNGSHSQAAGSMIEMMLYEPKTKTYAFHEIDFSGTTPVFHESPTKCLACHGSNPRPIWDHYNAWPGAYGDVDDRYNLEEHKYLTAFIEKAPAHPRYKLLKNLKEGYKLSGPSIRNGMTERSMMNRNRDFNLVLYQQRMKDVAFKISKHPKFPQIKSLLLYFLSKCYVEPKSNYQGDGPDYSRPDDVVASMLKKLKDGQHSNLTSPFLPDQFLDYLFTRLETDTTEWYLNSRGLATYKNLRDGSDRQHESWLTYLLEYIPEYQEFYKSQDLDYQVIKIPQSTPKDRTQVCEELLPLTQEGIKLLGQPLTPIDTPHMTMRGERVCRGVPQKCEIIYRTLPQICLKCHTQSTTEAKIYIPFHEFPEMVALGDKTLPRKMFSYISARTMPMRTANDDIPYQQYIEHDFPKLKQYLQDLLKKAPAP